MPANSGHFFIEKT